MTWLLEPFQLALQQRALIGGSLAAITLAVVEISHPVLEGKDLVYHYKLIEGPLPKTGGATALFIDWIGVGGGVGRGYHGVGRGARGVGWR